MKKSVLSTIQLLQLVIQLDKSEDEKETCSIIVLKIMKKQKNNNNN